MSDTIMSDELFGEDDELDTSEETEQTTESSEPETPAEETSVEETPEESEETESAVVTEESEDAESESEPETPEEEPEPVAQESESDAQKRLAEEMYARRQQEKELRRLQEEQWVNQASDEYEKEERQQQVEQARQQDQLYDTYHRANQSYVEADYYKLMADPELQMFNPQNKEAYSPDLHKKLIDDFEATSVQYDNNGRIIQVRGSLYERAKREATVLKRYSTIAQAKAAQSIQKTASKADVTGASAPKPPKDNDPLMDMLLKD